MLCHPTPGGSGVVASELALSLARRGHRVHVFAHAVPPRLKSRSAQSAVAVHQSAAPRYPLFGAPPHDLAMVSRILAVHEREGLDLLHAHYALPHAASALLAQEAALDAGHPLSVVTTLHGTDITLVGSDPAFAPIVRFALRRSNAVSCVSASLARDTMATFFPTSASSGRPPPVLEVIPNFVDTETFHPGLRRKPGPVRIVHASNLRPVKRVSWLLEAFARATANGSGAESAELWILGEGPERAHSEALAARLGLGSRVRFLGQKDQPAEWLVGAAAFALPSREEAFGLAALEAMATGVAPVASHVGGLGEVFVEGVSGFLVDRDDQSGFASRLRDLCVDLDLAKSMGAAARRRAEEHFPREALVDRYEDLYKRARAATLLDAR